MVAAELVVAEAGVEPAVVCGGAGGWFGACGIAGFHMGNGGGGGIPTKPGTEKAMKPIENTDRAFT